MSATRCWFGRAADCHARLPGDDTLVSRHHFLVEVNPPAARLRDLGSLNGTLVNGQKIGGRKTGETPEQGRFKKRRSRGGGDPRMKVSCTSKTKALPFIAPLANWK